ncbi:MAG: hypothetical protein SPE23_03285 [Sodaliphilus sp.]|nr:hypothetical protein [Sodaliphilus sp.]
MRIDVTSMFFNSSIEGKTATPAWGTSIGQSKQRECRIDDFKPEVINMLVGMTYKCITDTTNLDVSKGSAKREILLCSLFTDIFVNNKEIENSQYVLLLVREHSENHDGRLIISYAPYIKYNGVANQECINKMREELHCKDEGCWFVYDISIEEQSTLHFKAIVVDADKPRIYNSSKTSQYRSAEWNSMIPNKYSSIDKRIISNLYSSYLTALRTKPFMLLAGISGTGKSRIVRKLAQATVTEELQSTNGYTGGNFAKDRWTLHSPANFELIQVKPNWHNSMDVIGYLSNIPSPHYVFTPFIEFIVKAWQHPEVPFFLCLDEMNLAPVEEYFAEFLSAIESRSFEDKEYMTDPIIKPFNSFGEDVAKMMVNALFPNFTAGDTESVTTKIIKHFRTKGLTLPKNLIVIGTVNMDETTFSFSRKVLDRAMSIEMNEVDYDSFLTDTTDDDLKAIVKAFEENKDMKLNDLLVNRHIEAKKIIEKLGEDAHFAINYLKQVNALLEGTPFKLGYRAANEALIYLQASYEFGQTNRIAALDNFTLMKILSRIEGDETKLKITDSEADKERIVKAGVNVDGAKRYGDLNILTALRNIITQILGESGNADVKSDVTDDAATENNEEQDSTEQKKNELQSIKKIDCMLSQLKRDHFVSYWN